MSLSRPWGPKAFLGLSYAPWAWPFWAWALAWEGLAGGRYPGLWGPGPGGPIGLG